MTKIYLLQLNEIDLGQILDGLRVREESWRKTAECFSTGESPPDFIIEDCADKEEADRMAARYGRIIANLCEQRDAQS